MCSGGWAETSLTFLRSGGEKRWGQTTFKNLQRERVSKTGEEPDHCTDCPVTLGWLQVPAPSIHHHFPRKQLIPPELSQANIQRKAEKWNICGRVDTLLVKQEFSPRWSSNRLLTKSALFHPTLGMLFPLSTVFRAVLEGLWTFFMNLRAYHSSKIPFYHPPYFSHLVYCSPHENLIQNDMRRELPAQIKLLFIEQ